MVGKEGRDARHEIVAAVCTGPKDHVAIVVGFQIGDLGQRGDEAFGLPSVAALLLKQNDDWAVQRTRYLTLQTIVPLDDDPLISLPVVAR